MMWNRDENVLGLGPLSPDPRASLGGGFVPLEGRQRSSGSSMVLQQGLLGQEMMINAVTQKAIYAMNRLAEIDQHAGVVFHETLKMMQRLMDQSDGESCEAYAKEFGHRLVQLTARHFFGVLEIGATGIAKEVYRDPREGRKPVTGLLRRLCGG